jgi:hypothetical protein
MKTIEFKGLEKALRGTKTSWRELLAPAAGAASVVTISRDGCKGCELQKPALEKLAAALAAKHGKRITFSIVHIAWAPGSAEESVRSKKLLGHYFYPCTVILIRTKDLGPAEYYRCGSPSAGELKKYCTRALRAAEAVKQI